MVWKEWNDSWSIRIQLSKHWVSSTVNILWQQQTGHSKSSVRLRMVKWWLLSCSLRSWWCLRLSGFGRLCANGCNRFAGFD
jgi:hypothetical protein